MFGRNGRGSGSGRDSQDDKKTILANARKARAARAERRKLAVTAIKIQAVARAR